MINYKKLGKCAYSTVCILYFNIFLQKPNSDIYSQNEHIYVYISIFVVCIYSSFPKWIPVRWIS
jgi:hypothetical protein